MRRTQFVLSFPHTYTFLFKEMLCLFPSQIAVSQRKDGKCGFKTQTMHLKLPHTEQQRIQEEAQKHLNFKHSW